MAVNVRLPTDDIAWVQPGGGTDGALVFPAFRSPTAHCLDLLDSDRDVDGKTTIDDLAGGHLTHEGRRSLHAWNREER